MRSHAGISIVMVAALYGLTAQAPIALAEPSHHGAHHNHRRSAAGGAHSKHSSVYIGLGFASGFSLGGKSESSSGGSQTQAHAGHEGHGLNLLAPEDHGSHGGGPSSSNGNSGSGFSSILSARAGYKLLRRTDLLVETSFDTSAGLLDPSLGAQYGVEKSRQVSYLTSVSAALPLSAASRDLGLVTTLKVSFGPRYTYKRWTLSAAGSMSYRIYGEAPSSQNQAGSRASALGLQDHTDHTGHHHEDSDEQTSDSDHADSSDTTGTTNQTEHDHADHDGTTTSASANSEATAAYEGDQVISRETLRAGGRLDAAYKISGPWSASSGLSLSSVSHEPNATTYATELQVAKVTYVWDTLTTSGGLLLSDEKQTLSFPTTPSVVVSADYMIH